MLLNLIQLVYIFRDSSFLHGTYVYFVNIHVQIIGVLLATIWSTAQQQSSTPLVLCTVGPGPNLKSDRERGGIVAKGQETASSVGLQRAVKSSSEWLSMWTATSDITESIAELDLEGQYPVKHPELVEAMD